MKWIEIITLRSLSGTSPQLADELLRQILKQKESGLPAIIRIYHNCAVETDVSIHIHWEREARHPCESPLGRQLCYALKGLGLLAHSIWAETASLE